MKMGERIVTGLDIGSSKVSAVSASIAKSGAFTILGQASIGSRGVSRGAITDLNEAVSSVSSAFKRLQGKTHSSPGEIYVNISGESVKGSRSRGMIPLTTRGREITTFDMTRCVDAASTIHLPFDREIVHKIIHKFSVDDQPWIKNPSGLYASRLACEVYIITANVSNIQNIFKCVNLAGHDVKEVVFTGIADASAILETEEMQGGILILNMGSSLTEVSIFFDGTLNIMDIITVGAEDIKVDFASSDVLTQVVTKVNSRLQELSLAGNKIRSVALTGGIAFTEGVIEFLEEKLALPVKMGIAKDIRGEISGVDSMKLSTAIGLAKYACNKHEESRIRNKNFAGRISSTIVDIFNNYF